MEHTAYFVPSSFDPNDSSLTALTRPMEWRWTSLACAFARANARGIMSRLPLFWQAEIPLFEAARAAHTYIYLNDAKNMPVGAAALAQGAVDTVVTTGTDAREFAAFLTDKTMSLGSLWVLVHPLNDSTPLPEQLFRSKARIYQEIHSSPCVPLFVQCDALADAKELRFHLANDASVPALLMPNGTCSCGKTMYA